MTAHTPLPWNVSLARMNDAAPPFGFTVKAEGKVPYIASAGVSDPGHALIIAPEYAHLVTTGYSVEELVANAEFLHRAVNSHYDLLAALELVASHPNGGCSTQTMDAVRAAIVKAREPVSV
jgi:hypothetical protein